MCPNRQKMSRLLHTYSYTCRLLSSQYSPISANFPVMFFVAYKNWIVSKTGMKLQEISEDTLDQFLSDSNLDSAMTVIVPTMEKDTMKANNKFCLLIECSTERATKMKILFLKTDKTRNILITPIALRNLSLILHKTVNDLKESRFIYKICPESLYPHFAQEINIRGLQCSLLEHSDT